MRAETDEGLSVGEIETLRQLEPRSASVWNAYIQVQEQRIEYELGKRPDAVEAAMRLYRKWPDNLTELRAATPETDIRGMEKYFTSGMLGNEELAQLDAATNGWMKEKTAASDRQIQLSLADIELSRNAVAKMVIIAYGRHQKQQAMGSAVIAIADSLFAQMRENQGVPMPDGQKGGQKGKSDRLLPPTSSVDPGVSAKLATQ